MKSTRKILLQQYRDKHDCTYCMYYKTDKCDSNFRCYLEETERNEHSSLQAMRIRKGCLTETGKECPYGNDVGTCFGVCMRKILDELKENRSE